MGEEKTAERTGEGGAPLPADETTRERILDAAQAIIAEEGPDALSMRAVAARVGVTATTIYHYFDGKEELVDRVVRRAFGHFRSSLVGAAEEHPPGSWERIHALGEAYIRFTHEQEQYFRVLFAIRAERQSAIEELPAEGGYHLLREAVVEAADRGELREEDPEVVVLYLWAFCHGLVTLSLACQLRVPPAGEESRTFTALELFQRVKHFVSDGLRPRPGTLGSDGSGSPAEAGAGSASPAETGAAPATRTGSGESRGTEGREAE